MLQVSCECSYCHMAFCSEDQDGAGWTAGSETRGHSTRSNPFNTRRELICKEVFTTEEQVGPKSLSIDIFLQSQLACQFPLSAHVAFRA